MANKKITQLTAALDIKDGDLLVIVDMTEGQTEKITKLQLERAMRLAELQGTTDDLTEGTNNLWWSNARFDNRFAQKTTDDLAQGSINKYLTLSNLLQLLAGGGLTTDHIPEGTQNLYWTNLRFDQRFATKTTDNLAEGNSNLYFTNSRWDARWATKTTDDLAEGAVNKFWTQSRFNVAIAGITADNIAEGVVNKYYSDTKVQAYLNTKLGQPNGIATLDANGKVPAAQLSSIYTTEVYTVADIPARDALLASPGLQSGDIVHVASSSLATTPGQPMTYIYTGSNFIELKSFDTVTSVNGYIGHVTLNTNDIPEGPNNLYWTGQRFDDRFASKSTDNLQEGIGNLYFTNERVRLALNGLSINELMDVDMIQNPPVPNYILTWSGTQWVPRQPQAFTDGLNVLATPTDLYAGFLNQKVVGKTGKTKINLLNNIGQTGNEQIQIDIGTDVFDKTINTTDNITEGSTNLFYTQARFNTHFAQRTTDDLAEGVNNKYYTDARVQNRIDAHDTVNVLLVDKAPTGAHQFATITAAIAYINTAADASESNQYIINIGPGLFIEQPFVLPSWVSIYGHGAATIIRSADDNTQFITMRNQSSLNNLTIDGPNGIGANSVGVDPSTGSGSYFLNDIEFRTAYSFFKVVNNTANDVYVTFCNISVHHDSEVIHPFHLESTSTGLLYVTGNGFRHRVANPDTNIDHYVHAIGANTTFALYDAYIAVDNGVIDVLAQLENGSTLISAGSILRGANITLFIPDIGLGPIVKVTGSVSEANTLDVQILNPLTSGSIVASLDASKVLVDPDCNVMVDISDSSGADVGQVVLGEIRQGADLAHIINLSKLAREGGTMGALEGGQLTSDGSSDLVDVAAGYGFVEGPSGLVLEVHWNQSQLTIPNNTQRWIVVDYTGAVTASATPPVELRTKILLGRVHCSGGVISIVEDISLSIDHHGNHVEEFFRDALGPVFAAGCIAGASASTPLKLDVTAGRYYYGTHTYLPEGGEDVPFFLTYRNGSGGYVQVANTTLVPVKHDNNTGSLQDPTSGYYVKHALYIVGGGGDEKYALVVGQAEFDNLSVVEQASIPLPPTFFNESFALIASVIVQEGNPDIVSVRDERPVIGFKSSGVAASTFHGNLLGLADDDHLQYLHISGIRPMEGNLDMGGFNITNIGTLNGVNITAHASRHLPGGADALATGVPVAIGSSNIEGTASAFARQDHVHAHGSQGGGSLHALATVSQHGFMSSTDKQKLDGLSTTTVPEGTNLYYTDARVLTVINSLAAQPNGLATLGGDGKIPTAQLPALAISDVHVVANIAARNLLVVEEGDIAKVLDADGNGNPHTYIYDGSTWISLKSDDAVDSVNGKVGAVILTTSDITEGSNLYWTQARFNTAFAAKSTTDLVEGTNLYYTQGRFDTAFAAKSTTDLAEGANLYFTGARAITAVGGSKNDSGTGTSDFWSASKILSHLSTNYYLKTEFIDFSTGVPDAGKPVKTNAFGMIDPSMIPSFQIVGAFETNAVTTVSTTSTTFVLCPSMTLTPPAGSYLVIFNSDLDLSANNKTCQLRITVDGVEVSSSLRFWTQSNSTNRDSLVTFAIVTVNGSQVIQGQWRVDPLSTGTTLNSAARTLKLIKVALS